jgi:ABC-type antimicrobial peptide transport system permease subunit
MYTISAVASAMPIRSFFGGDDEFARIVLSQGYPEPGCLFLALGAAALFVGGAAAALAIGAIGLYPAMRAARLSPTEALRTA